jgi:hypothetical protein
VSGLLRDLARAAAVWRAVRAVDATLARADAEAQELAAAAVLLFVYAVQIRDPIEIHENYAGVCSLRPARTALPSAGAQGVFAAVAFSRA